MIIRICAWRVESAAGLFAFPSIRKRLCAVTRRVNVCNTELKRAYSLVGKTLCYCCRRPIPVVHIEDIFFANLAECH